jgi:hypothetical protein
LPFNFTKKITFEFELCPNSEHSPNLGTLDNTYSILIPWTGQLNNHGRRLKNWPQVNSYSLHPFSTVWREETSLTSAPSALSSSKMVVHSSLCKQITDFLVKYLYLSEVKHFVRFGKKLAMLPAKLQLEWGRFWFYETIQKVFCTNGKNNNCLAPVAYAPNFCLAHSKTAIREAVFPNKTMFRSFRNWN